MSLPPLGYAGTHACFQERIRKEQRRAETANGLTSPRSPFVSPRRSPRLTFTGQDPRLLASLDVKPPLSSPLSPRTIPVLGRGSPPADARMELRTSSMFGSPLVFAHSWTEPAGMFNRLVDTSTHSTNKPHIGMLPWQLSSMNRRR